MARARSRVSTEPGVLARVVADGAPERPVAQLVPQHVQHASPLFVEVGVEEMNRLVVLPADHRPLVTPRLGQVAVGVDQQLVVGLVAPLGVLAPDVLEVGGEPFVQPGLGPLAAGQQIAPPLVRQLVRDEAVDVVIQRGPLVEQRQIGQRGGAGVLHPAEDELGDGDLAVARVRIGQADLLGEVVDHRAGPGEAAARVGLPPRRREGIDVDAGLLGTVAQLHEGAHHQREEVRRLGQRQRVVPAGGSAIRDVGPLPQISIRQHEGPGGRRADHLGRELFDRLIEAGPKISSVVVLPLRPALRRAIRVAGVGADEVEPASWPAGVADGDLERLVLGRRLGQRHVQRLAVVHEGGGVLADGHLLDVELDGVEPDRRQPLAAGGDRQRGRSGEALGRQIDLPIQADVIEADRPVADEVRTCPRRCEGARGHGRAS